MFLRGRHLRLVIVLITGLCSAVVIFLFIQANINISKSHEDIRRIPVQPPEGASGGRVPLQSQPIRTGHPSNDDFMQRQAAIQKQRLHQLQAGCKMALGDADVNRTIRRRALSHFIVDDKYRLVYCHVPKVASTSWIRVFLVLKGIMDDTSIGNQTFIQRGAMSRLRLLHTYDGRDTQYILANYTKFLFVRNPFSRLLSAFKNKLAVNPGNDGRIPWYAWIRYVKEYINKSTAGDKDQGENYNISFSDFVKFVGDPKTKSSNQHWNPILHRCFPCHINYTFIGKIESLQTDVDYLFKLAEIEKLVTFPSNEGSSPTNSTNEMALYYHDIPKLDINNIYRKFKRDFNFFGYDNLHDR
ncbi:carbohydrate sulfotransferase 11-like isoform X1 [Asterias amurensis]|uniref:carbohydrate sulfotransferase 11-like isoform X1 n=1 Tax=Asterias amurensis TaxID=7602 RepID=UPI003AB76216